MDKPKIIEALKDGINGRDKAKIKVERLEKAIAGYEEKANHLIEEIEAQTVKIAEMIGEGEDPAKAEGRLQTLRRDLAGTEAMARQIKEDTLPEARRFHKGLQETLEGLVRFQLKEPRAEVEMKMNKHIDAAMDEYDAFNDFLRNLYQELAVTMIVGTMNEVPKVKNERFTQYFQNIGG
jgi:chromosome segregation ATPase